MVIKFDKYNDVEEPQLILCNPGSHYSSGDITQAVGELVSVSDIEIQLNFNSTSSLDFRLYDVPDDQSDVSHMLFESVEERRYIFVPDIGYFVIKECPRTSDLGAVFKDVSAVSCDTEFSNRLIPYIEGTYPLITDGDKQGILNILIGNITQWSIGHVDTELNSVYRSFFDLDDINMRDFLIDKVQKAYECIVEFNIITRVVNVYTRDNYVKHTDIYISETDFVKKIKKQSSADDLYTAIRVIGDGKDGSDGQKDVDVGISRVNPVGGNVIYNYDHYLSWMSSELASKVIAWEQSVKDYDADYTLHSLEYYELLQQKIDITLELQRIDIVIEAYTNCKNNIIQTQNTDSVVVYNEIIVHNGGVPITIEATIQETIDEIDGLIASMQAERQTTQDNLDRIDYAIMDEEEALDIIRLSTVPSRVFTQEELEELSLFTFEGIYKDEFTKITDTMTMEEEFVQIRGLYRRGTDTLNSVSQPRYKFDIDVESFQLLIGYSEWINDIQEGCSIDVEIEPDVVVTLFLSGIRVNYEEKSVKLTFGNIIDRNDMKSLFEDVIGMIKKSANSVSYI